MKITIDSFRHAMLPTTLALAVMAAWQTPAVAQSESSGSPETAAASGTPVMLPSGLFEPTRGLYARLGQSVRFEDNIFRRGSGQESDVIGTTSATLGTRLFLSRQVLNIEGTVLRNVYQDNDQLDNTGYRLNGRLAWEVGNNLAGSVQAGVSRDQVPLDSLIDLPGGGGVVRNVKNQAKTRYLSFDGRYGLFSMWSLEAFGDLTDVDYTDTSTALRARQNRTLGLGVLHKPSPDFNVGLRISQTQGEYTNDDFDRSDITVQMSYAPGDRLRLKGSLSYADEKHDQIGGRDYSGLTGSVSASYALTSKITLNAGFTRQTGTGETASQRIVNSAPAGSPPVLTPELSFLTDARLSNILNVGASWAATSKIAVRTSATVSRDNVDRSLIALPGSSSSTTTSTRFNLGASWAVHRIVGLSCDYSYIRRDAIASVSSYSANVVGCSASVALE
ncbi:outer membrane beta-barrel protein [Aquariibacter albus]|uniref:Outer membrane beta-barrel protein n=1 Tax=Aquariibacter albus TaxID=2759899 RepID=A0A839HMD5_9BURK|nr:outer membrane beta-barrel protein [Aquariibacter albus]MBB1162552.1 outer membrane beta-barrel protein [Aquariibacter albus]